MTKDAVIGAPSVLSGVMKQGQTQSQGTNRYLNHYLSESQGP